MAHLPSAMRLRLLLSVLRRNITYRRNNLLLGSQWYVTMIKPINLQITADDNHRSGSDFRRIRRRFEMFTMQRIIV